MPTAPCLDSTPPAAVAPIPLDLPLYATKPRRHLPGTSYVAVATYRSSDKSVATYTLFADHGAMLLGPVHFQPRRRWHRRGYSLEVCPALGDGRWPTLEAAARELESRLT